MVAIAVRCNSTHTLSTPLFTTLFVHHTLSSPTPSPTPPAPQVLYLLREDQVLLQRSPRCADTVVAILTACASGVEGSASAGRPRAPVVQQALVTQIVDMGFPRHRVEEALRRVGGG